MSGKGLREKAKLLPCNPGSRHAFVQKLIVDGFFDAPVSSNDVVVRVREKFGKKMKVNHVQTYMEKFMVAEIIHGVKPLGHNGNYWVLSSVKKQEALKEIGKHRKVLEVQEDLFSDKLVKRFKKDFAREMEELHANFGKNGNCTAFLLRKILEKLLIIVFTKNGKANLLEDKHRVGGWSGLKEMVETAAREKLNGVPFLIPKTAQEIMGIKFLGDTAAHNPLAGVEMRTILPQMPYIITAYEELTARL